MGDVGDEIPPDGFQSTQPGHVIKNDQRAEIFLLRILERRAPDLQKPFSAVVAQEARRKGFAAPALQLLIYPVTDWGWKGGSMDSCAEVYPLTREIMDWFGAHYLNAHSEAEDVRVSPMKEPDLSGLPPAIIVTSGFDPLRDQGAAYAEKLKSAGVVVAYRCEDSLPHAFTAMTGVIPAAREACERIARDIGTVLGGST